MSVCVCVRACTCVYGDKFINGAHWRMEYTVQARRGHVLGTEISDVKALAPATSLFLWGVQAVSRAGLVVCGGRGWFLFSLYSDQTLISKNNILIY